MRNEGTMTIWEPTWTAVTSSCAPAESKSASKGSQDICRASVFVAVLLCMCVLGLLFEESRLPSSPIPHPTAEQTQLGESVLNKLAPINGAAVVGELGQIEHLPAGSTIIQPTATTPESPDSPSGPSLVAKSGESAAHTCQSPHPQRIPKETL